MYSLKRIYELTLAICASGLCGCAGSHGDEPTPPQPGGEAHAIVIGAFSDQENTPSRSYSALAVDREFAVNIRKTLPDNSAVNVMSRYKVAHNGSEWYYAGIDGQYVHYWDVTAPTYDIFVVLPYEASATQSPDADMTVQLNGNVAPTDLNNVYAAVTRRSTTSLVDVDVLKPENSISNPIQLWDGVPLYFHPQMCNVVFNLQHTKQFDVQITSITITTATTKNPGGLLGGQRLKADGTRDIPAYRSEMGGRRWAPNYVIEHGEDLADPISELYTIFETRQIAQSFNGSFDFNIQIQTREVDVDRVYRATIDTGHASWEAGKTYTYNLTINPDNIDPILFTTLVLDWEFGGENEKTDDTW